MAAAADSTASRPLQGRVAVVTGGSRGIGRAIALHLAALGANLVIGYAANPDQADLVAAEINSAAAAGSRAVTFRADVAEPSQVKALFDKAEETYGSPVNVLVNSAGVLDPNYPSLADTPIDDFDKVFSVNARGAFVCCREAANRVKRGGGGRIIMLSSSQVAALKPGFGAYTASKAAVEAMVKILAKELKGTAITANCVAPGPIATEMFFAGKSQQQVNAAAEECPLGRLGEAADVAPIVGFLATDASEWVNGQIIRVNGGYV